VKPVFAWWEVTFDARLSNSNLQNTDMSFAHWTPDMRDWYHTLETWDGASMFPVHEPHAHHHKKPKWHKRLNRAWKVLIGKEV
jgi:hypothetical protein